MYPVSELERETSFLGISSTSGSDGTASLLVVSFGYHCNVGWCHLGTRYVPFVFAPSYALRRRVKDGFYSDR